MDDKPRFSVACDLWRNGQPVEAGRLVFEALARKAQPPWAANILKLVVNRTGVKEESVSQVVRMAFNPSVWIEGHRVFGKTRRKLLELLRRPRPFSTELQLVLEVVSLAELVAKVSYNATDPFDEFDADSGWHVAASLHSICALVNDSDFTREACSLLCSPLNELDG